MLGKRAMRPRQQQLTSKGTFVVIATEGTSQAYWPFNNCPRGAMVRARVVRRMRSPWALRDHLGCLQRDGVTRDGDAATLVPPCRN
ncbi:hypothetical protein WN72_09810 [Bradyrhizobium arachidis]|uniref:Uncharacterized protein n=1 Tax=Bradyrhizobium arachidis TaxID=858423 RepID=A0AAE7NNG1_9BRAD|nr:hypothetical protein WN72_09810 [Bradyrhizobium arachidis]